MSDKDTEDQITIPQHLTVAEFQCLLTEEGKASLNEVYRTSRLPISEPIVDEDVTTTVPKKRPHEEMTKTDTEEWEMYSRKKPSHPGSHAEKLAQFQVEHGSGTMNLEVLIEAFYLISKVYPDKFVPRSGSWKAPCLLAERKFSKMVDREFSLKFLFKSILHRLGESGHSPDPQKNPITAICCAPGGGKTRFIDEVASLFSMTDKRNEAFKSAEVVKEVDSLNKIFDGLVPISITYNAGSIYCDDYDDAFAPKNPPAGFALRVLFNAYFEQGTLNVFRKKWKQPLQVNLQLDSVIDYIINKLTPTMSDGITKKGVFLFVDELRKADGGAPEGGSHRANSIVSSIGSTLTDQPLFAALVSTLDVGPIKADRSGSGRPIHWVPLPPASSVSTIKLFIEAGVPSNLTHKIEFYWACVGGHFRSLGSCFPDWEDVFMNTIQTLTLSHIKKWGRFGIDQLEQPSDRLITAALLREAFGMEEKVDGITLQRWCEMGVCYQPVREGKSIPNIPLVVLCRFFGNSFALKDTYNDGKLPYLRELLRHSLVDVAAEAWNDTAPSHLFEIFHLYWENLRRSLLVGEGIGLQSFYCVPGSQCILSTELVELRLPFKPKSAGVSTVESLKAFINATKHSKEEFLNRMFRGCETNDPIDSFYFELLPNNQLLLVVIENKYRERNSGTTVTTKVIIDKHGHLMDILFEGEMSKTWSVGDEVYTLTSDHVVLVVASYQILPTIAALKTAAKDVDDFNVILMGEHQLMEFYPPTLMPIPLLWMTKRTSPVATSVKKGK